MAVWHGGGGGCVAWWWRWLFGVVVEVAVWCGGGCIVEFVAVIRASFEIIVNLKMNIYIYGVY